MGIGEYDALFGKPVYSRSFYTYRSIVAHVAVAQVINVKYDDVGF